MRVLDMIEQRKQMLQKEVISTKQPSHKAIIILSITYSLKLQLMIYTWVLIHPVMNFIISTPINLAHLCLLGINFNPDYSGQITILNPIHSPTNQPDKNGLVQYIYQEIYKRLSQESKDALQKYYVEAVQKFEASRNLNETELMHYVYEHTQEELPTSIDEEEIQECQQFNTDQDLEPPTDDILEFITSQGHSDDQLDQVLQTYQAYQQSQSETEPPPPRQMNAHITYHVAQAKQAKHGALVDRGANGVLAGSDVRILSTSPRKCIVTGIDNHEIPGLDLLQCAALVQTNYGTVNLIINEYAYYGRGHSIHSSGEIEWYTNTVDDKSVLVGGQQRIVTIDGYLMPLVCKGGLMYLQLQGIPTDQDLQNYPSAHLRSPHEWDPSVLDYEHSENNGEPDWAIDPNENLQFDQKFYEFGDHVNRSLSILDIFDETPKISQIHELLVNKHVFQ